MFYPNVIKIYSLEESKLLDKNPFPDVIFNIQILPVNIFVCPDEVLLGIYPYSDVPCIQ